jgi:hypothetical protein
MLEVEDRSVSEKFPERESKMEAEVEDGDDEDFEVINEEDFGESKLTSKVEKELIQILEKALIDESGNLTRASRTPYLRIGKC